VAIVLAGSRKIANFAAQFPVGGERNRSLVFLRHQETAVEPPQPSSHKRHGGKMMRIIDWAKFTLFINQIIKIVYEKST